MPNDAISREAAIEELKSLGNGFSHKGDVRWVLDKAIDALASLPADTRVLDPEETKAVLRQALSGCGPMAIVYAEAAINEMAGIESPKEE
jgi:hypothetical protein